MQKFFCIFCPTKFDSRQEIFEHLNQIHMSKPFYCLNCDSKAVNAASLTSCLHPNFACDEEFDETKIAVKSWMERFLLYQDSLRNYAKPINPLNQKIFRGCPVCDKILWMYSKQEWNQSSRLNTFQLKFPVDNLATEVTDAPDNAESHIYEHLKYLPFECIKCRDKHRVTKQYCSLQSIKRHLKKAHAIDVNNEDLESLNIKVFRIQKMDEFVDHHVRNLFGKTVSRANIVYPCQLQFEKTVEIIDAVIIDENTSTNGAKGGDATKSLKTIVCRQCLNEYRRMSEFKRHHIKEHPNCPIVCFTQSKLQ